MIKVNDIKSNTIVSDVKPDAVVSNIQPHLGEVSGESTSDYTKLLLHLNGADGTTTVTDSSHSGHSVTVYGDAQIDTAQSKFGGASLLLDGTGDYISCADHADWTMGTGDFTVDFWLRRGANGAVYCFGQSDGAYSGASRAWEININASDALLGRAWITTNQEAPSPGSITSDGLFHHVALIRNGSNLNLALDGIIGSAKDIGGSSVRDSTSPLYIGSLAGLTPVNGWIDEFRVSKGTARWTANFTPPTAEYTPRG